MIDLNDREAIRQIDPKDVYGSTGMFADQCRQIVDEFYGNTAPLPAGADIRHLIICGMGGSAYGAHVAQSLYAGELKVPLIGVSDYHLPGFADEHSLVLLTSYSGSTEEVLSCAAEAEQRGAHLAGLSSGGQLGRLIESHHPGLIFEPRFNPSAQPRLGTGYIITGTLVLLNNLGLLSIARGELETAIGEVREALPRIQATAQEQAPKLMGFIPVTFAAQHLVGNAHIIRNQFNETSKSFSAYEDIPELNHHLMEGFKNPEDRKLKAIFLDSSFYEDKHARRVALTKDVVAQNGVEYLEYQAGGSTRLAQVLDVLAYGGYLSLYLALLYGQDPSLIPWVDYFKDHLD